MLLGNFDSSPRESIEIFGRSGFFCFFAVFFRLCALFEPLRELGIDEKRVKVVPVVKDGVRTTPAFNSGGLPSNT